MWSKHFKSMYEGSMYGAGIAVFAVWGYVLSHTEKGKVELNPKRLADTLGGSVDEVVKAIEFLCNPDKESRFKEHEGRRMLKDGEFQYYLPAWQHYQAIRNEEDRRESNRMAQERFRAKKKVEVTPEANKKDLIRQHKANAKAHLSHAVGLQAEMADAEKANGQ